jgi:hypothetical protein
MRLTGNANDVDTQETSIRLLNDIRHILKSHNLMAVPTVATATLIKELYEIGDGEWKEYGHMQKPLTAVQLASLLRPYKIQPVQKRVGSSNTRHYHVADFRVVFDRYLRDFDDSPELIS